MPNEATQVSPTIRVRTLTNFELIKPQTFFISLLAFLQLLLSIMLHQWPQTSDSQSRVHYSYNTISSIRAIMRTYICEIRNSSNH